MNIYELPKEIENALYEYYSCFDEENWELVCDDSVLKEKESALFELQNKKDDLIKWYLEDRANRLSHNLWIDSEIERLLKMKKSNESKIKRIENIIDYTFRDEYKWKPVMFWNFKIWYRKSKQTIILDEDLIPSEYKKEVVKTTISKSDIKKAIESGKFIQGASVCENMNLNIK